MSTNYPTSLDTLSNPTSGNGLNSPDHAQQHADANDAIEALEAKVGITSSAVTTSHDYKLGEVTGTDKAVGKSATQTLTNKTLTSPILNLSSNATGDIYYRDSGGALARLAIGSTSNILTVSAEGLPSWTANPSATNASTTVAGIVEEATAAEVLAGTATGATGARLFVNPSTLNTVPFYQQNLPTKKSASFNATTASVSTGSNQSGSVLYVWNAATATSNTLQRFARDSVTGMYQLTHSVSTTYSMNDAGSIVEIGSYIYIVGNDNTNLKAVRFLAADLTGETVMTVPTVASTSLNLAWSDGTYLYIVTAAADTTVRQWSVSGTTFSAVTTSSCPSFLNNDGAMMYDGTTLYCIKYGISNPSTVTIKKFADVLASSVSSTTTIAVNNLSGSGSDNGGSILVNIDSTKVYYGTLYNTYNATVIDATWIALYPITKP